MTLARKDFDAVGYRETRLNYDFVPHPEVKEWCDDYIGGVPKVTGVFDMTGAAGGFTFASEADGLLFWKRWLSAYPYEHSRSL